MTRLGTLTRLRVLAVWVGTWIPYIGARIRFGWQRLYDEAMVRWWPYDRWPREWRSVFRQSR